VGVALSRVTIGTRVVPTKGLSRFRWFWIIIAAVAVFLGSLLLLLVETTGPRRSSSPLSEGQIGLWYFVLGLLAAFLVLLPWLQTAQEVRVSDSGVEIKYPLRTHSFEWKDMMTVKDVGQGIVIFRPTSSPVHAVGGSFIVSIDQAREILSDPRCAPTILPEEFRRSIFPP